MLGFIALMSHVDVQEGDHDDQHHQCNRQRREGTDGLPMLAQIALSRSRGRTPVQRCRDLRVPSRNTGLRVLARACARREVSPKRFLTSEKGVPEFFGKGVRAQSKSLLLLVHAIARWSGPIRMLFGFRRRT